MGEKLVMNKKERKALVELELVEKGIQTLCKASEVLELSYRQVLRKHKRFKLEGEQGLIHRSRGRKSNRSFPEDFREKCLERYALCMSDFGPTFASEKLEALGYKIHPETLRLWLIAAGLWERQRKRRPHRFWREPRKHFGEMVQMDGSFHDWFEDGNNYCLMNMVDDATGITFAQFYPAETTVAAMEMLWQWIELYGIPRSLYTDRNNVYVTNRESTMEEELSGDEPLTAFGKACAKLGIRIIEAHSPQAKGRVERKNGVFQDRLIKDMRFHGITGIEAGNKWLREKFLSEINEKFCRVPASPEDFHQKLSPEINLKHVFVLEDVREVQNDYLIRWNNRWFQLLGKKELLPFPRKEVIVQEMLDGKMRIVYRNEELEYKEIQKPCRSHPETSRSPKIESRKYIPGPNHPWRRFSLGRKNNKNWETKSWETDDRILGERNEVQKPGDSVPAPLGFNAYG